MVKNKVPVDFYENRQAANDVAHAISGSAQQQKKIYGLMLIFIQYGKVFFGYGKVFIQYGEKVRCFLLISIYVTTYGRIMFRPLWDLFLQVSGVLILKLK